MTVHTVTHVSSVQVFVLGHENQEMSLSKCLLDSKAYLEHRLRENGMKMSVSKTLSEARLYSLRKPGHAPAS